MKKLNYLPLLVWLMAFALAFSCAKESFTGDTGNPDPNVPTPGKEIGSIVDLGVINSGARVMSTNFTASSIAIDGYEADMMTSPARLSFYYYVDKDAEIPNGEYSFAVSDSKLPFTFDSAFLTGFADANGYEFPHENIIGGSVLVSKDGRDYIFEVQGHLESGKMISGYAKGELTYYDNHIYPGSDQN